ncbi:Hypothetical protein Bdt_2560 [Bdellovibrio bacteriovorus str. Tiberius]|uniref:Uncharacterized protein n=1 Tax=Bdellovibrio bacteriovorus str. Tiberius TaxID=1069642 RepID=K7YX33_BDEBC|nr:Hypothetical protein Bdt_2560 [Bdellovibrio bacteriovorus str. Tiberius]
MGSASACSLRKKPNALAASDDFRKDRREKFDFTRGPLVKSG